MTDPSIHLGLVGVILLGLGAVHVVLPRTLRWREDLAGASALNQEVSYVHCYFIGLACLLWGLLPLTAGQALLEPNPVTRLVLLGAVAFWASRLVIQLAVFNHHARESRRWWMASAAGTALWLYLTAVWTWALAAQFG
jgi:hypothetical protein